jgi:hypothetical protein
MAGVTLLAVLVALALWRKSHAASRSGIRQGHGTSR